MQSPERLALSVLTIPGINTNVVSTRLTFTVSLTMHYRNTNGTPASNLLHMFCIQDKTNESDSQHCPAQ